MENRETLSRRNWLVLLVFGLAGQIAWSVENMYFNLFVFDTIAPRLDSITLMVQLSGIVATVVTLIAGTLSDKVGNRSKFISIGYIIWGISVALFGFISPDLISVLFSTDISKAVSIALIAVIVGDCIMTMFGSTANDACFNAWVTDNTRPSFRGRVEGVLAILPLIAMLIVAGGFGILVSFLQYSSVFLALGILISLCGVFGLFTMKDSENLKPSGTFGDIFYGFRPSVVKKNAPLYLTFILVVIYGIACQVFMPFLIIYMKTYLGFSVLEYSAVFGVAIVAGAAINLYLGRLSDRKNKVSLMYFATVIMSFGLFMMYIARGMSKISTLIFFGLSGFVMITGYIFTLSLSGSLMRDFTPEGAAGKLQGVRMVFSVLIPMIVGPMIGNAINKAMNIPLENAGADAMTTSYIPAPEIFLVGGAITLIMLILIPVLKRSVDKGREE